MTDSSESPEIDEVRRLLADARHTEPMPDDVVARMDDVLAGLRETPAAGTSTTRTTDADDAGPVVSLAAHRRRRAAGLLVAAAAIVVGGVVVAQNLPQTSNSSETASTASGGRDEGSTQFQRSPGPQALSGNDARVQAAPKAVLKDGRLVVRPRRFSADALAGQQILRQDTKAADSLTPGTVSCLPTPTGAGVVLRASYQRAPAALVYRPASGGSQVVDLFVCGSRRPVRSATLPAP